MKSPITLMISAACLALTAASCSTAKNHPAAGYTPKNAYNRGFVDGGLDRIHGLAHNPHINEDNATLPSAYRNDYLWGYCEGYKNPRKYEPASSK